MTYANVSLNMACKLDQKWKVVFFSLNKIHARAEHHCINKDTINTTTPQHKSLHLHQKHKNNDLDHTTMQPQETATSNCDTPLAYAKHHRLPTSIFFSKDLHHATGGVIEHTTIVMSSRHPSTQNNQLIQTSFHAAQDQF
jgi:hypothetical protein